MEAFNQAAPAAGGLLRQGYAVLTPDPVLQAALDSLQAIGANLFERLPGMASLQACDSPPEQNVGFSSSGSDGEFSYREGAFTDALFQGLSETEKRSVKSLIQRQEAVYSQMGTAAIRILHTMGCYDGADPAACSALAVQTEKGLRAGSGGGEDGEASLSSLVLQRLSPSAPQMAKGNSSSAAASEKVDSALLTMVALPAGDASFHVWDRAQMGMVAPAASVAATGAKWVIVVFSGHLFDVSFGNGDGTLSTPFAVRDVPSPSSSSSGAVAGKKRSRSEALGVVDQGRFSVVLHVVPDTNADLDLARAKLTAQLLVSADEAAPSLASSSSSSLPAKPMPSMRCIDLLRAFAARDNHKQGSDGGSNPKASGDEPAQHQPQRQLAKRKVQDKSKMPAASVPSRPQIPVNSPPLPAPLNPSAPNPFASTFSIATAGGSSLLMPAAAPAAARNEEMDRKALQEAFSKAAEEALFSSKATASSKTASKAAPKAAAKAAPAPAAAIAADQAGKPSEPPRGKDSFQIFIRDHREKLHTLWVTRQDTVADLKKALESKTYVPVETQALSWGGKAFQDSRTLGEYNVQKEATLLLRLVNHNNKPAAQQPRA